MATSQQQPTARTVTSINTQRTLHELTNPSTSNNLKHFNGNSVMSTANIASTNYCKDSLNDTSANQDLSGKHIIKLSRKDVRPLTEAELAKRTKPKSKS